MLRKRVRAQSLWNLHLAGDWHYSVETMPVAAQEHMMRVRVGQRQKQGLGGNGISETRIPLGDVDREPRRRPEVRKWHSGFSYKR